MRRATILSLVLAGVACVACLQAPQKDAKTEALEKRVAELEAQLNAKASPSPRVAPRTGGSVEAVPVPRPPRLRDGPRKSGARPTPSSRSVPPGPSPTPELAGDHAATASEQDVIGDGARRGADPTVTGPDTWTIADGVQLELALELPVSSRTSVVGDRVVARVVRALNPDGHGALPGGSVIEGRVSRVRSAARLGGQSRLAVVFDRLRVAGRSYDLEAIGAEEIGRDEGQRDRSIVTGGAVAGAVVGGVAKGRKGALRGALIGALGGAGAAAATRGRDLELPAGSRWTITVHRAPRVDD
jgi:hypothetical protein